MVDSTERRAQSHANNDLAALLHASQYWSYVFYADLYELLQLIGELSGSKRKSQSPAPSEGSYRKWRHDNYAATD